MTTQKILQLNVWLGKIEGNLKRFLEQNKFDVICMQEVMFSDNCAEHLGRTCFDAARIIEASGMSYSFFSPNFSYKMADGEAQVGNLILSRTPFAGTQSEFASGSFLQNAILGKTVQDAWNFQMARLENGLIIINHHGYWQPNPLGNEDSVKSMQNVADFVKPLAAEFPLVMCGDLNIEYNSPAMRPLDFLTDLTVENQIDSTLSGLKYDGKVACDHILINDKIKAVDFGVRSELVSDHLALETTVEF